MPEELKLCEDFEPKPWYRPRCGDFCVQKYCKHWVGKKTICIEADPAGNTYEVIEAHCGLRGAEVDHGNTTGLRS